MSYFTRKIVLVVLFTLASLWLYFYAVPKETLWTGKDSHFFNLSMGLLTGLIILVLQYIIDNKESIKIQKLLDNKIIAVLPFRDDDLYYRSLIEKSKSEIIIFGVTGRRFLNDFADIDHLDTAKRVLLIALDRGVKVKFLLAGKQYLTSDLDRSNYEIVVDQLRKLIKRYPTSVAVKYYQHSATLSMVLIDENCLVGPVFKNRKSQYTSTIHALASGDYAKAYIDNFDLEWTIAI